MIALGYDSDELHETWNTPATHSFTVLDETTAFTGPTYDINTVTKTDLDFEFYDLSKVQSGPLPWITVDSSTNIVTVAPTLQEF